MKDGICPKCHSNKIVSNARVLDRSRRSTYNLTLEVLEKPHALIFKGNVHSTLSAFVCGECGYSELYAEDPKGLWLSYEISRDNTDQ